MSTYLKWTLHAAGVATKKGAPKLALTRYRVLGALIPDLDDVVDRRSLPTSSSPILPLHLRPALLAGIAIVERSGPEMLQMLHGQMRGENKARFSSAIEEIINSSCRSTASSQLQLI
ncbi:hypothetical protein [Pseudorhizobium tarimense]|uniref:hypothetical protein n=1 Tax=Pseudorhizobium tarimense TaxID=1079109 RepID=UPI001FF4FCB9|nr:hypothetical protein [Pseudorhizobium tarimense]